MRSAAAIAAPESRYRVYGHDSGKPALGLTGHRWCTDNRPEMEPRMDEEVVDMPPGSCTTLPGYPYMPGDPGEPARTLGRAAIDVPSLRECDQTPGTNRDAAGIIFKDHAVYALIHTRA